MRTILLSILIVTSATGCCTRGFVADHYRSAVVVRPMVGVGGIETGIDILGIKAWWVAWKANKIGGTWNALLDGLVGWAAAKGGYQLLEQTGIFGHNEKEDSGSDKNQTTINGDGNTVNNE